MSDQFDNKVDGEIWITRGLTKVTTSGPKDGSQKPGIATQYAIAYANGKLGKQVYDSEGAARLDLMEIRNILAGYGVDEEQWPVLMERQLETVALSWKILSV